LREGFEAGGFEKEEFRIMGPSSFWNYAGQVALRFFGIDGDFDEKIN